MSYTITLTDGTTLTTVVDGSIDQTSSDLTLIGKNSTGYGAFFNENFVHLMENFANTSEPNYPIKGQLWYDTADNVLKIYNGVSFNPTGNTIVSRSVPSGLTTGGLWISSTTGQLYFNDGTETILAGPAYTTSQGVSGFQVTDVIDTNGINHTIVPLYVSQVLLGIFSKDAFTPANTISGYSGSIQVGFNAGTYSGIAFNVPVTVASKLLAADGTLTTPESFLSTVDDSATNGTISIQNSVPLVLGATGSTQLNVNSSLFQIQSNSSNQNFEISTLVGSTLSPALFINATAQRVGIFTASPQTTLDINGSVLIEGNLTVNGTTTSTNTSTINLADYTITLANTETPSNTTANGAGIIVAGTTNKTLLWQNANTAWGSSENFNLASGKSYKINGFDVLTGSALGSVITSAPGITSVGNLTSLQVANISISGSTLTGTSSNATIVIAPNGTGSISASLANIINVADPILNQDAANKRYVDASTQTAPLGIALTTTNFSNAQIATVFLSKIYPAGEHLNNTLCRVVCTDLGTTQTVSAGSFVVGVVYMIVSPGSTTFTIIGSVSNSAGTIFVASGAGSGSGTASPVLRQYQLLAGTWTFQSNL